MGQVNVNTPDSGGGGSAAAIVLVVVVLIVLVLLLLYLTGFFNAPAATSQLFQVLGV
jgi:uncharacterized protein HemY